MQTFEKILPKLSTKPKLLLGNGFSIAYDSKRFSFTSLLDSAVENGVIEKNSKIYKVFESLKTSDFEDVLRALEDTKRIVEVYESEEELQKALVKDVEELKKYLVAIVTNNHPAISSDITPEQKLSCGKFLNHFDSIYTLNYDLLLYWTIMNEPQLHWVFTDGFGEDENDPDRDFVIYNNTKSFKLHYLHGALHLFDAWHELRKKTFVRTQVHLVTQIRESLDEWIYPVFVSEGTKEQKMTKITHSWYLNHCYKSLKSLPWNQDLVIYGTNLKCNDEHILDAIISSNVKSIYIWTSDPANVTHIQLRINEYNEWKPLNKQKTLTLFNSRSVNPWKYASK